MQSSSIHEIINGTLLGDGCIFLDRGKYARYKLTAKDEHFVSWISKVLIERGLRVYILFDKRNSIFILHSSTSPLFTSLRNNWYKQINGKTIKTVPKDLKLTPATLLFWYLGDGV